MLFPIKPWGTGLSFLRMENSAKYFYFVFDNQKIFLSLLVLR